LSFFGWPRGPNSDLRFVFRDIQGTKQQPLWKCGHLLPDRAVTIHQHAGYICSTLLDCFETQAYGASYESVDGKITAQLYMAAGSSMIMQDKLIYLAHSPEPPSPKILSERMQHDTQLWAE
jgi:hypothetical protein